jgi:hypothetical protein
MKTYDFFTVSHVDNHVEVSFGNNVYATAEIDQNDIDGFKEFIYWCEENFDESDFLTGIEVGCQHARYVLS